MVEVEKESFSLGGAGNVLNNILSLGGGGWVVAVVGEDEPGREIVNFLKERGAENEGIFILPSRPTTVKTRIIAHHQQVVRVDKEIKEEVGGETLERIFNLMERIFPRVGGVVVSDYGKGMITSSIMEFLLRLRKETPKPLVVDPKPQHISYYRGVTSLTPNWKEAAEAVGKMHSEEDISQVGKTLMGKLGCETLLITQGEKGMTLFERGKTPLHIPTLAREVYDVTGAGDTVAALYTLSLACQATPYEAATIANHAAGVVVRKVGTAGVTIEELEKSMEENEN